MEYTACLDHTLITYSKEKNILMNIGFKYALLLLSTSWFLFQSNCIQAQDDLVGIGEWRSHLAYSSGVAVTQGPEAIFFASTTAILKVNKADNSLEHLNKVYGLSDMLVKTAEYNPWAKLLVVAYVNGNIDLVYDDGRVVNLSAIKVNNNIVGNKSINHIYNTEKEIYFSCAFGLVVYDLDLEAFSQTTFTPTEVNASTRLQDTIFIATDRGLYKGIKDGRNLLDFGQWIYQGTLAGVSLGTYSSRNLITFNNKVYGAARDTLYEYTNGRWQHLSGFNATTNTSYTFWKPTSGNNDFVPNFNLSINADGSRLVMTTNTALYYTMDVNNVMYTGFYGGAWRIKDIAIDEKGEVWAADQAALRSNSQEIDVNSPYVNRAQDMHVSEDGALWIACSSYNTFAAKFNRDGFARYKDGEWTTFNWLIRDDLDTIYDAIRVVTNPDNGKAYVGTFMSGLIEVDENDNLTFFNQYNSDLGRSENDPSRTRITGMVVDDDGVLWLCNNNANNSLIMARKLNGEWKAFPRSLFFNDNIQELVLDRHGYKWIRHTDAKISVLNTGRLNDDTDNQVLVLGQNNTKLPVDKVTAIASDKDGAIWAGTAKGITIFNCPSNLFDRGCEGNRPIIEQDNFNGFLLDGEEITVIEVDGGNRKWVGTKNGLFVLAPDGEKQLAYFTAENSPLFDNEVTEIAIDGVSGTVYIGTATGIQSIRGEATRGERRMNQNEIEVFPHPVAPGYDGPIAISKLADDANVKITDASGRLVFETQALGGQAIWNGTDYNGRRAQSGVYLVFVVNEGGGQTAVGKILFLN